MAWFNLNISGIYFLGCRKAVVHSQKKGVRLMSKFEKLSLWLQVIQLVICLLDLISRFS